MLNTFAAEGTGIPLAAEPVFHVGPLAVTNSMFFGMIVAVLVLVLFAAVGKRTNLRPRSKLAFAFETLADFLLNTAEESFGDRKKAIKHLPLLMTLFVFIFVSNLSGLMPGVGSVTVNTGEGTIPLLRAFTTDLNATLALAVLSIGLVQFYAIKELGIIGHLKHYFTDKPYNPMNLFLGLIEVMGEFIRILTLSMRLFGVIYAGEVLMHVVTIMGGNFGWASTIPVYLVEIFFSTIQAYIFVMLTTVYLSIATTHAEGGVPEEDESDHSPADLKPVADVLHK